MAFRSPVSAALWFSFVWFLGLIWLVERMLAQGGTMLRIGVYVMMGLPLGLSIVLRRLSKAQIWRSSSLSRGATTVYNDVEFTRPRVLVMAATAALWICGFFALWIYFPSTLESPKSTGITALVVLVVPLLVLVTYLEQKWRK